MRFPRTGSGGLLVYREPSTRKLRLQTESFCFFFDYFETRAHSEAKMPRKSPGRKQMATRAETAKENSPRLDTISESREAVDGIDTAIDKNCLDEITIIDVASNSLKIGWGSNLGSPETTTFHYLLQWKLDGTDEWNSLPETVSVPRVRLDQLLPSTRYSFRVRKKSIESTKWSEFSKSFSFSTLSAQAVSVEKPMSATSVESKLLNKREETNSR